MIRIRLDDGRIVQIDTDDPKEAAKAARRIQLREKYEAEARASHPSQTMSTAEKFAVGAGRGFADTIEGVKQIGNQALAGLGSDAAAQRLEQQRIEQANELEEFNKIQGLAPTLGRVTGGVASVPLPAARAATTLGRLAQGAAMGGVAGGAQYVPEGQSRAANVGMGLAFGAGGQGLAEGAGRFVNKLANQRAGNLRNADILQTASREGVPVGYDDISGGVVAGKIGNFLDRIPIIGNQANRRATQHGLETAMVRRIADAGDEIALFEGIKRSAKAKLRVLSTKAGVKYDALAKKVDPAGRVDFPEFTKVADDLTQNRMLTEEAENALGRIGRFLDRTTGTPFGTQNFTSARNFRTDLSYLIDQNFGRRTEAHLIRLKHALEKDMRNHAFKHGGTKLWREADDFYKKEVLNIKLPQVRRAVADQDATKLWRFLVSAQGFKGGNPEHAKRMYRLMGPQGRRLVKQGLFTEAFEAATKQGEFSPAIFQNQLQARKNLFKEFANGDDIDGLIKLMQHTKSAGRIGENPPTGNRVVDIVLFGIGVAEPIKTISSVLAARFFFNNPTTRNFLLAASKATPGTARMGKILDKLRYYSVSRAATLSQTQPER